MRVEGGRVQVHSGAAGQAAAPAPSADRARAACWGPSALLRGSDAVCVAQDSLAGCLRGLLARALLPDLALLTWQPVCSSLQVDFSGLLCSLQQQRSVSPSGTFCYLKELQFNPKCIINVIFKSRGNVTVRALDRGLFRAL